MNGAKIQRLGLGLLLFAFYSDSLKSFVMEPNVLAYVGVALVVAGVFVSNEVAQSIFSTTTNDLHREG
jgi:hypothetical protein